MQDFAALSFQFGRIPESHAESHLVGGRHLENRRLQYAETNIQRDVLTKQVKAGQEMLVAKEPKMPDGGNLKEITAFFLFGVTEACN
jgi:hypothetical protein